MMDDILSYIYNSVEIDKYIKKVVPYQFNSDMKSHLILEMYKVKQEKLDKMYNEKTLKYLAFRVIKNQMDPKCSNCFYRKYIKPTQNVEIKDYDFEFKEVDSDDDYRIEQIESILRSQKPWKANLFRLYYTDGLNFREISEKVEMNPKTVQSWIYEIKDIIKKNIKR